MPVYPCHWPTCTATVARRGYYCPAHEHHGRAARAGRDRFYDAHLRDADAKAFYNSARWKRARHRKLSECPWCERCNREWARHVHHRKPLKKCTYAEQVDQRLLKSVCISCHNEEEAEANRCT